MFLIPLQYFLSCWYKELLLLNVQLPFPLLKVLYKDWHISMKAYQFGDSKKTECNFFYTSMPCLAKQCTTSNYSTPNAINSVRTEYLTLDSETLLYVPFLSARTFDFSNVLVWHCVTSECFIFSKSSVFQFGWRWKYEL